MTQDNVDTLNWIKELIVTHMPKKGINEFSSFYGLFGNKDNILIASS